MNVKSLSLVHIVFGGVLMIYSCGLSHEPGDSNPLQAEPSRHLDNRFQTVIDSVSVLGSILIYDPDSLRYYSNDYEWADAGHLPASTFKIPNSIIALETGTVEHDSTVLPWDGTSRAMPAWEQDLSFKQAFQYSCVPCYQQIAREVGVDTMRWYLDQLSYDTMRFDESSIDMFWLQGKSRISQFDQIDFLRRLYHHQLPISPRTYDIMDRMMFIERFDEYALYGKTGWSIDGNIHNGWFVGYVIRNRKPIYFATNVTATSATDMSQFPRLRRSITMKVLNDWFE